MLVHRRVARGGPFVAGYDETRRTAPSFATLVPAPMRRASEGSSPDVRRSAPMGSRLRSWARSWPDHASPMDSDRVRLAAHAQSRLARATITCSVHGRLHARASAAMGV